MTQIADLDRLIARARKLTHSHCAESLALAAQAAESAAALSDAARQAQALCALAVAYFMLGNTEQSFASLARVRELADSAAIGTAEGDAVQLTARNLYTQGEYAQAREYWQRCLTMPDDAITLEDRVLAHIGLGQLYYAHEHYETALAHHQEAEELAASSADYHLQSGILINIAADLIQLGRHQDAHAVLKDALPLVRADQNYEYEAEIYSHIATLQLKQGEHDKARMTVMVALKINRLHAKQWAEATNLVLLARCYLAGRDFAHARDLLRQGQSLASALNAQHLLLTILGCRIELAQQENDLDEVARLRTRHEQLRQSLLAAGNDEALHTMELRFETA
ncbi:tetratricopeptide repeat protein [Chitinilyticum litopenaei]|uniref:tetratricopeptide repeat protein n=1 Tax=Chitinilyticum litopenaei TaxID=1121276 RepID=UPI000427964C|nr:tetratricopeptide repeat protein [Chitinilyticum litopenaei]